jgi:hypothetical protein
MLQWRLHGRHFMGLGAASRPHKGNKF